MAKYDLNKPLRKQQFIKRVKSLLDRCRFVELKDLTNRSINQNSYMHLCFKAYSIYTGFSFNYTKQYIFKEVVNPSIFIIDAYNPISKAHYEEVRSTASLSVEECSTAIDNFKEYCAKFDFRLPEKDDLLYQREIEEAYEQQKRLAEQSKEIDE